MKNFAATLIILFLASISMAQELEYKGSSAYKKSDITYISPDLRGKHGASLGFAISLNPRTDFEPTFGAHVGYNYLVIRSRKRLLGVKETKRDEVLMGFGAHLYVYSDKAWFLNVNYLNSTLALRGKIISYYFFNEIGFGLHYSPPDIDILGGIKPNISFEPLRFRLGKTPLNLCIKTYFDLGNSLLSKDRMNITLNATLKYYFYRLK